MKYIISVLFSKTLCLGHQPGADLGPVISPHAKERICNLVQSGADEGAKVRETSYPLTLSSNINMPFSTLFFINFYGTAGENLFNHQDYSSLVIILFLS